MLVVDRYLASRSARWTVLILVCASAGYFLQMVPYQLDFDVYRTGGQVFLAGGDLYGDLPPLALGTSLPFTYPPFAAALFSVFALIPLAAGEVVITSLSLAGLAVVVYLVLRSFSTRNPREVAWLVAPVLLVGLWTAPVVKTLELGQINILLMAMVVVDLLRGHQRWWGGIGVGIAIAIKITPIVFGLVFLARRDWKGLARAGATFLACSAAGWLLRPHDSLRFWTRALRDPDRVGNPGYAGNQSLYGFLYRFALTDTARTLAWLTLALAAGLAVAWASERLVRRGQHTAAVLVVSLAALLCSPISWSHHWVWVLPLVLILSHFAIGDQRHARVWWTLAGAGVALTSASPYRLIPFSDIQGSNWNALDHLLGSTYLVWALAVVCCLGAFAPARSARPGG